MKTMKILVSIFFAVLLIVPAVNAQSDFEGKLVIETSGMGQSANLDYFVKGNKVRINMNSARGQASIIMDKANKKMYMIMPAMKMYMEFPMDMMNKMKKNMENSSVKIEKTSEEKKINGYNCVKWILKEDNGNAEAWLTKDLGKFTSFSSPLSKKSKSEWEKEIEESGNFPMLVIQKDNDGNEKSRFEVKSVEKENLDDPFFSIPDGYKKVDMNMGGMK